MPQNYKFKRLNNADREKFLSLSQKSIWSEEGTPGLHYLVSKRKLSENIVRDFGIGYVPKEVCHQLSGRVIFPLYDPSGNLITLMTRHVDGDTQLPVYWHERYEKSFYVYGMNRAKDHIRKLNFAIIVEGQIDALQFHNHGVYNVVSICGTNMSNIQMSVIQRYCDEIIVVLDSDENNAGQQGTSKILKMFKANGNYSENCYSGFKIDSVSLPIGFDPDEYICTNGIDEMKKLIREKLRIIRN